jgi:hypothetical protein
VWLPTRVEPLFLGVNWYVERSWLGLKLKMTGAFGQLW